MKPGNEEINKKKPQSVTDWHLHSDTLVHNAGFDITWSLYVTMQHQKLMTSYFSSFPLTSKTVSLNREMPDFFAVSPNHDDFSNNKEMKSSQSVTNHCRNLHDLRHFTNIPSSKSCGGKKMPASIFQYKQSIVPQSKSCCNINMIPALHQ